MIHDNDIELIEKYLSGKLTKAEEVIFNEKNTSNNEFSEEVQFRENLKVAAGQLVSAEFKAMFHNIHANRINKNRRAVKFYLYGLAALAAAALVLLFFFFGNPMSETHKIENYIADAGRISTFPTQNISDVNFKSSENNGHNSHGELEVAFIENEEFHKNHDRYFFSEKVLYLFKQAGDSISLFYKLEGDGVRVYYLYRNKQLYSIHCMKENSLFDLQPVTDIDLKKYFQ
jgi:hypothetical protein